MLSFIEKQFPKETASKNEAWLQKPQTKPKTQIIKGETEKQKSAGRPTRLKSNVIHTHLLTFSESKNRAEKKKTPTLSIITHILKLRGQESEMERASKR